MAVLFISDLHLDTDRPEAIGAFVRFTENEARQAESLYILGDLFEAWIGDDDDEPGLVPILDALESLTQSGTQCRFMHGNRDFLVGGEFSARTGVTLLREFETIELFGELVLLTHGDLLCSDDVRYLELRRQLRDASWQRDFLGKSLEERRRIAAGLRELSQTEMAGKSDEIMDVNQDTVCETMNRFGVLTLIHGHTHRPAMHQLEVEGAPARRIVLDDWYGAGAYLAWDEDGPRRVAL